jgi:energy-coupling factor transporter ATP-binding protein EcfA2
MEDRKIIDIILTPHQDEKLDIILTEIKQNRKKIVLTGSAGTGKTTLVNFLIDEFTSIMRHGHGSVYIAAPTHKALSVLKTKIAMEEELDPVIFCTVHKGLKLKMQINNKTGSKKFVQNIRKNDPPFRGCKLLIIDEASMLSQYQLDLLEQYDFPIVFVGDEKQVNPVKEIHSPVFHQNWLTVKLTEIIRQGEGNPIIELSNDLSMIQKKVAFFNGVDDDKAGFLYSNDRPKVIYKLAEVNGTDELKYLAWTNAEVDAINFSVRAHIYGNPRLIEQGEVVVLNNHYVISKENILHNNQEVYVEELEVETRNFFCGKTMFTYKVYVINQEIYAIHEDFIGLHHQNVRQLKAMAINKVIDWAPWYKFQEQFLDFKYNHAITVHKSQGSTYKDTIINIKDIMRNRVKEERQRLLYTAVTRASNLVVLYNV